MKKFIIEYVDQDGIHDYYECRAEYDLEAKGKFYDWSEDIGEVLRFVRFVD